jgi:hypothetical protein
MINDEKFKINVGAIDFEYYKKNTWLDEQYRVASIIHNEFGKDFVVMIQGDIDSEIILQAFNHLGITPRVIFVKFKNDYNLENLKIAHTITADIGIDLEVIEFDVIDFYKSGQAYELAGNIQCCWMPNLILYHHILKMQMPTVIGKEILLRRHATLDNSKWYYCFRENEDASAMRFSLKYGIPLVNEWFSYTPEMIGYYLDSPLIKKLTANQVNYKLASTSSKRDILKTLMPSINNLSTDVNPLMGFNKETNYRLCKSYPKRLASSLDGIFIDSLKIQLFGDRYAGN